MLESNNNQAVNIFQKQEYVCIQKQSFLTLPGWEREKKEQPDIDTLIGYKNCSL